MSWEYWTPESDKPSREPVPDWAQVIAAKDAEVEALKADLDTFMKIANAEAAEAERLRAALETIGRMKVVPDDVMNRTTLVAALQIARAALEGKQ